MPRASAKVSPVSYDRRTRDRFRLVVTGVTGAVGVGALTADRLLMGLAAGDFAEQQADQQADQPDADPAGQAAGQGAPSAARRKQLTASGRTSPGSPSATSPGGGPSTPGPGRRGVGSRRRSAGSGGPQRPSPRRGARARRRRRRPRPAPSRPRHRAAGPDRRPADAHARSTRSAPTASWPYAAPTALAARSPLAAAGGRRRRRDLQPVPRRLRPEPGSTGSPGRWVDVDPLLVAAVAVGAATPPTDRRPGLTRCSAGRWCSSATTATSASSRTSTTCADAAASTYPPPTPGATIGLDRTGRIRIPAGTALDLGADRRRPGPPTWSRPASSASSACRPWSASAGTCGSPHPTAGRGRWPSPSTPATRARGHRLVALDDGGLATSSTRVRRWSRRGRRPPPPARPAHRPAGAGGVAHRHRHRPDLRRRQHQNHLVDPDYIRILSLHAW